MRWIAPLLMFFTLNLFGQKEHLVALSEPEDETVSYILFENDGNGFSTLEAFRARRSEMARNYPRLNVAGDFTGNGVDEVALLGELDYTPNLNPWFTCSIVSVSRSDGTGFVPTGTWFSTLDTLLDFDHVNFSVAGDFNLDGWCDIALFYNDPSLDVLTIYLLESNGSGFGDLQTWYTVDRNEFNFTAIKFACPGDFNGNGKPDIAVFYNYFGTAPGTSQAVFLFESDGSSFSLLPSVYNGTKADYDFSSMNDAAAGDYNLDGYSDIAVLLEDTASKNLVINIFTGSISGDLSPEEFIRFTISEIDPAHIVQATGGDFAGDTAGDMALFYDNPVSGNQEILLLESGLTYFKDPVTVRSEGSESLAFQSFSSVLSGNFVNRPAVAAATWKDDRRGALSFTFDDGYRGAFEYGGGELEAAGLKGTFYIFTDTTITYDAELAPSSLVRAYKVLGHEIGSHTANHSDLGLLTGSGQTDSMDQVLMNSVELLNERFDQRTLTMSIPFGSFRYETLDAISRYFLSARSSQYGFNLATPYDLFALRSWPVLSSTSPARVDSLLQVAETYGYYLPLMYHDLVDGPFDEEVLIYTYSRQLFHETVQMAAARDLWIDTHGRIYKYIMERNALKIKQMDIDQMESQPGYFSFVADDGLTDSVYNEELTLKIILPRGWIEDTVTVGQDGSTGFVPVVQSESGNYILYNWLPDSDVAVTVYDGKVTGTGIPRQESLHEKLTLKAVPNPFLHESLIEVPGDSFGQGYLVVRDLQGRIVREIHEKTSGSYLLRREGLLPGIYLIQLMGPGRQATPIKVVAL